MSQDSKVDKVWYVYIARCADDTLYTGISTDVDRRIQRHNSGRGAKYTRTRKPVKLEAHAQVGTLSEALSVERRIKKLKRDEKIPFVKKLLARDDKS